MMWFNPEEREAINAETFAEKNEGLKIDSSQKKMIKQYSLQRKIWLLPMEKYMKVEKSQLMKKWFDRKDENLCKK